MARSINNPLLTGVRGRIGDIIIKQYSYGTVITKVPDMPKRQELSPLQELRRKHFADAVQYAKSIIRDRQKKAEYAKTLPPGRQVFNAALQEYLRKVKEAEQEYRKGKS